jgi:hypothetical protein
MQGRQSRRSNLDATLEKILFDNRLGDVARRRRGVDGKARKQKGESLNA